MPIVIVGGGPAADGAAIAAREAGYPGGITVVSEEPVHPYQRPPLSKAFLSRKVDPSALSLRPREHYDQSGVTLRIGDPAVEVDADRRQVRLASGGVLPYDRLLLATGAAARRIPGVDSVTYLRGLSDAHELRSHLERADHVTIVGAGFIGAEVAATAAEMGRRVSVYEQLGQPLQRVLGEEVGAFVAGVHREHGVDLRLGVTDLPALPAGTLVAIGSEPRTELALGLGLEVDRGVLVDELGRTSIEGIYAAGDVARFWSPIWSAHIRVEHFQTAGRHGAAVGRAMAGLEQPFAEAPWFWSDQYDLAIQYVGAGLPWERTLVRGGLGRPPFTAVYLAGDTVVGAAGFGDNRTISALKRLIEAGVTLTDTDLEDTSVDLKRLVPRG